ncbi:MAG TPA: thiol:disulfide interchange protein, partial [Prolixibacteraceae bacterium]|nr:thiol:disulfide interchange protein [Prolixibacteraceae bacterium]
MKFLRLIVLTVGSLLLFTGLYHAQVSEPVKWKYTVEKISETEAMLVFSAKIDEGWHLYSQYFPEGGPIPMVFTFNSDEKFSV